MTVPHTEHASLFDWIFGSFVNIKIKYKNFQKNFSLKSEENPISYIFFCFILAFFYKETNRFNQPVQLNELQWIIF